MRKCGKCQCEYEAYQASITSYCKPCKREYQRANDNRSKESVMLKSAKKRAVKNSLPFDLCINDIVIPLLCPVLGITLNKNNKGTCYNSPSLDRLIPSKGYVKDNVNIISMRANFIKNNASYDEVKKISEWMKSKQLRNHNG